MHKNSNCCGEYRPRNNYDQCFEQRCPDFDVKCPYGRNDSSCCDGWKEQKGCECNERHHKHQCGLCDCIENFFKCLCC